MKSILIFFSCVFYVSICFSQYNNYIYPNGDDVYFKNPSSLIRNNLFEKEIVYAILKKSDSVLVCINHFDSLGDVTQQNLYNSKSLPKPYEISSYDYTNGKLIKKTTVYAIPNMSNDYTIITYDMDSVGNVISEKNYHHTTGDSDTSFSISEWVKEYDSLRQVTKLFVKDQNDAHLYLRSLSEYLNGQIVKLKTFDADGSLSYSYNYEYNNLTKKTYLVNLSGENIETKYFYNNNNQLILKIYYQFHSASKWQEETKYEYNSDGTIWQLTISYNYNRPKIIFRHSYLKK